MPESNHELQDSFYKIRDNEWYLEQLTKQLSSPLGVLPFIGAGLSRPLGYPTWSEFLISICDDPGLRSAVSSLIDQTRYEEAAEEICNQRHPRRFEEAVRKCFGAAPKHIKHGAHSFLPFFSKGPVITTNFDRAIETAFEDAGLGFDSVAKGSQVTAVFDGLAQNRRLLIKLHGDWEEPESRVLTIDQYTNAYGSTSRDGIDRTKPLPRLLQMATQHRPLLFIGCSLGPDRTLAVLQAVNKDWPELLHYAILELPSELTQLNARDRQLAAWGIRPIWYPHGEHHHVEMLLAKLVDSLVWLPQEGHQDVGTSRDLEMLLIKYRNSFDTRLRRSDAIKLSNPPSGPNVFRMMLAAGYVGEEPISLLPLHDSPNGKIYDAVISSERVIVKLTHRKLCEIDALRELQRHSPIAVKSGDVSCRVGIPLWIGESSDYVVEIDRFYEGITLDTVVRQSPSNPVGDLLADIYLSLIGCAIKLSRVGVMHRDIAPDNILVHATGNHVWLALIDVTFSSLVQKPASNIVYNRDYTAPEQRRGQESFASEVYSVGAVCYFLANGVPPDPLDLDAFEHGLGRIDFGLNFWSGKPRDINWHDVHEAPYSGTALIRALLKGDARDRPTRAEELRLNISSRAACAHPILGVLDLSDYIVLDQRDEYEAHAKGDIEQILRAIDRHGIAERTLSDYFSRIGVRVRPDHFRPRRGGIGLGQFEM